MTPRQNQLLAFLKAEAAEGRTPNFEEMRAHLGVGSKSNVHRIIEALELYGKIRRWPRRSRAIEVIAGVVAAAPPVQPSMMRGETVMIRLYGKIA